MQVQEEGGVKITYIFKGSDGVSRLCGVCGAFLYVRLGGVEEVCSVCGQMGDETAYREVWCAHPDHNAWGGCGNSSCWKYVGGAAGDVTERAQ